MTSIQHQPTLGQVGIVGAIGGGAALATTVATRKLLFAGMPGLAGNVAPTLLLGGMTGLSAAGMSHVLGGGPLADAGVIAGAAGLGAVMQMGHGRAAAAHGAVVLGAAAAGGVLLANLLD